MSETLAKKNNPSASIGEPASSADSRSAAPELIRSGDVLALRDPKTGRVLGFHGREMQVAELAPELWTGLFKGQNSPNLSDDEREALNELALWKISKGNSEPSAKTTPGMPSTGVQPGVTPKTRASEPAIRSLTINVAQVCNLACTYCAAGGDGTYGSKIKTPELERTRLQLAMLLEKVPTGGRFAITFLGGEPLLVPELISSLAREAQLLVVGRDIKLRFDIVTNGTLVTPEIAELLAKLQANVTVSIDGAPEDNDRARLTKSGRGSSAMILKGLAELIKVKDRLGSLTAGAVFGSHNLNVVAAWKFLSELPFDSMKFDFAAEAGDEFASRRFAQGVVDVAELAFLRGGETELRRLHTFNHLFETLDSGLRVENHCLAGKNHLQLDTDGRFTACQWFVGQADEILGQGTTLDLSPQNPKFTTFQEPLVEKSGCNTCWARHICGGGCMHVNKVKTGNKHKVDQAYCERTRTIIAKGIERYAEARYHTDRNQNGAASEIH